MRDHKVYSSNTCEDGFTHDLFRDTQYEVELSDALMCTNGSTQSAMELSVDDLLCTAIVSTVDSGNLEMNPSSPMSIVPTRTRIRVTLVATARS